MISRNLIGTIIALWLAGTVQADLVWDTTRIDLRPHPVQRRAVVRFTFRNAGEETVEIRSVRPSCSCLSVQQEKRRYLPGESGAIEVTFDFARRIGRQHKTVDVVFVEAGKEKKVTLTLTADIPRGYRFSATRLLWEAGDRAPKTVTLTNLYAHPIEITGLRVSNPRIHARLETVRKGFAYRIVLQPDENVHRTRAVVWVKTAPPKGRKESRPYLLYLHVK